MEPRCRKQTQPRENLGALYEETVFLGYIMTTDVWTAKAALNYEVNTVLLINFVIPIYFYRGRKRGRDIWPIILTMGCWAFGTNFGAGNGNLNSSVFKSSNTRRGVLKFRINQCIVYISGTLNFQEMKEFIMMILKVCNLLFILLQ